MTILEIIRAERGCTQRDVSGAAGLTQQAVDRAERRGIRTYSTAARYAAAINKIAKRRGLALAEITPHMLIDIPETLPPKRDGKHYTY